MPGLQPPVDLDAVTAGPDGGEPLVARIKWTTLSRVVLLTCVLIFAFAMDVGMGPQPLAKVPETTLYQLTSAFYLASFFTLLATHLARHTVRRLRGLAVLSMATDVLLALTLVTATDGLHSVFLFAFPLAVLNSALLLYRGGAMAAASMATLGLWAMGAMELQWIHVDTLGFRAAWLRTLPPHSQLAPVDMLMLLLVQTAAVYGTAFLASHLALQLDRARRRASMEQRELATLRVRYDDVVSSMPDGILTVSPTGLCTSINPAGLEILGVAHPELLSQPLTTVLPGLVCSPGSDQEQQLVRQRQTLACRTVALRGTEGALSPGFLVVFRDMTTQLGRDQQHRARERLAAIGAMAAAVAHEIRNPLASISGAVQMLQTTTDLPATDRQLMAIVVRETDQLSSWIGEFLDFSRPRPVQFGPCDVRQIALDTLAACGQDPRIAAAGIDLRAGPGLAPTSDPSALIIAADAPRLRQLIWNLLVNASQAVLQVEVRIVELDLTAGLHAIELTVGDSGPGVDPMDIAHVFEPFYTTKGEGTGLGLATVKRHAVAHNGDVRLGPSSLGGARFVVVLPRRQASAFSTSRNPVQAGLVDAKPNDTGEFASMLPTRKV